MIMPLSKEFTQLLMVIVLLLTTRFYKTEAFVLPWNLSEKQIRSNSVHGKRLTNYGASTTSSFQRLFNVVVHYRNGLEEMDDELTTKSNTTKWDYKWRFELSRHSPVTNMKTFNHEDKHRRYAYKNNNKNISKDLEASNKHPYNWKNEWYAVTFASHIPDPHSESDEVTAVSIFGEPIILWKEKEGGPIYCADDRCPHRQAALSQGRVTPDGRVECNYHGWCFGAAGSERSINNLDAKNKSDLASIPNLQKGAQIPRMACLKMHPVQVVEGVVWVWMGEDAIPTRDPPRSIFDKQQVGCVHEERTILIKDFQYDIPANHIFVTENILDPAHINFVHDGNIQGANRETVSPLEMKLEGRLSERGFQASYREKITESVSIELPSTEKHPLWRNVTFIAPGTIQYQLLSSRGTGVKVVQEIHNTPLSCSMTRQLVRTYFTGLPIFVHFIISVTPKFIMQLAAANVIEQDIPILATQEANVLGSIYRNPLVDSSNSDILMGTSDTFVLLYRKWLKIFANTIPFSQAILNGPLPLGTKTETSYQPRDMSGSMAYSISNNPLSQWQEGLECFSRYHLHVQHSPITRKALKNVKVFKRAALSTVVFAFLMSSVNTVIGISEPTTNPRVVQLMGQKSFLRLGIASLLSFTLLNKLENIFYKTFDRRENLRRSARQSLKKKFLQWWNKGSNVHAANLFANAAIFSVLLKYGRDRFNPLVMFCLFNNYVGQIFDNTIKAAGSRLGEGSSLRRMSKIGLILHGTGTPLAAIPITTVAFPNDSRFKTPLGTTPWILLSVFEFFYWISYEASHLQVVDKSGVGHHEGTTLAGTLSYTSGKTVECLAPVMALLAYQIGVGTMMILGEGGVVSGGRRSGLLLLLSAFSSVLSCSFNRPDAQFIGETFYIGSLYAILLSTTFLS